MASGRFLKASKSGVAESDVAEIRKAIGKRVLKRDPLDEATCSGKGHYEHCSGSMHRVKVNLFL